jgi:hypothetical protein
MCSRPVVYQTWQPCRCLPALNSILSQAFPALLPPVPFLLSHPVLQDLSHQASYTQLPFRGGSQVQSGWDTPRSGSHTPTAAFTPRSLQPGSFFGGSLAVGSLLPGAGVPGPGTPKKYMSSERLSELVHHPMADCGKHTTTLGPEEQAVLCQGGPDSAAGSQLPSASLSAANSLLNGGSLTPRGHASASPLPPVSESSPANLPPLTLTLPVRRVSSVELPYAAAQDAATPSAATPSAGAAPSAVGAMISITESLLRDSEAIAVRLAHAFPWNAMGQAHVGMALRRREAYLASSSATVRLHCAWRVRGEGVWVGCGSLGGGEGGGEAGGEQRKEVCSRVSSWGD